MRVWLKAFRLRTLPLSFACILSGSAGALADACFDGVVFSLCVLTTLFLQILSNLANDLGDALKGVDGEERIGPTRTVQSGLISRGAIRRMIVFFTLLSLVSGLGLLYAAFGEGAAVDMLAFAGLGGLSILGALMYTLSKRPYGYMGLGDLAVFLFFGLLGVLGPYYLLTKTLTLPMILLAIAIGLLCVGVLNCNNTRDIENDIAHGKRTIPSRIGERGAGYYQTLLILSACLLLPISLWLIDAFSWMFYLPLFSLPLFGYHLRVFLQGQNKAYDDQLRFLSLSIFLCSLLIFVGASLVSP